MRTSGSSLHPASIPLPHPSRYPSAMQGSTRTPRGPEQRTRGAPTRWLAGITLCVLSGPSLAASPLSTQQLDEVTVTARRISERLHDVSVSATVIDGRTLDDTAVTRWEDINVPGIKIGPAGLTDVLSIRGMASGINFGFEQSAPVFIDGVWFGSSRASRIGFLDTERVEILKGPQPTWYGRNAIAGAFGLVTRKPRFERDGLLELYHEFEHDELAATGMINQPLGETLALRVAGKWRRMDGFMRNSVDGRRSPEYRDRLARAALRWSPDPSWVVDAKVEYSDNLTTGRETQYLRCVPNAMLNKRLVNPEFEDCEYDTTRAFRYDPAAFGAAMSLFEDPDRPGERIRNEMLSTRLASEWSLAGGYSIQAIAAWYDHDFLAWVKPDHSWNQRVLASFDDSNRLASQELRLASPDGGRWSWSLGAYHEDVERSNAPFTQLALPLPNEQARTTNWVEDSSSWALFGEAEWRVLDSLSLRASARHTRVRRAIEADLSVYNLSFSAGPADDWSFAVPTAVNLASFSEVELSRTDSHFTPSVSLEWRPQSGALYYLSWRKGFKAGGFSSFIGGPVSDLPFGPEKVRYLEGGAKWLSDDGRWRASAALFHSRYRDLQVPVQNDLGAPVTRNAGGAVSRGADLDLAWAFARNWQALVAVGYLDSTYRDYRNVACYQVPAQTIAEGCVRVGGNALPPGATTCLFNGGVHCAQDLSGRPTSFAPKWSGTASLRYQQVLPQGAWREAPRLQANVDLMATEGFHTTVTGAPGSRQGGYATLDARLALQAGRWEVALLGRNLTNRIYASWYEPLVGGGPNSGWFATTARTRQVGVQVRAGF